MDSNRLSRNYKEQPLGQREQINYEDFYYLYWELNLTKKQVAVILGCSDKRVYNFAKGHNLIKTQEMITASQKNLMIEKYGTDNYMKTPMGREKCAQAIRQVFKERKDAIIKKSKTTYKTKTGYENPSQNPAVKLQKEETCLGHYGVKNPQQSKIVQQKTQETMKEKYNGNPLCTESILYQSVKQSIRDKYGCVNPMQNNEIAQKTSKTLKANQEVYKQRNKEKYGVNYLTQLPEIINRIDNTKRKNRSYNKSSEEDKIFELLKNKYAEVIRQYKSVSYPFKCDFYIPELDLFIEYQGGWRHGKMPFEESTECLTELKCWEDKAKTSKNYQNAIHTWTVRDVKKRNVARENNLNWLEFFTMEEFMEWYNGLK